MRNLRILLADDHNLVRRGLRDLISAQPGWEVCAEAVNGREAVDKANQLRPDIVVLDISMPELNGLEAARRIRKQLPESEVLILTVHESEQLVEEVLAAGARGYICKSDADSDLVAAIKALSQHRPFFTSKVAHVVPKGCLGGGVKKAKSSASSEISAREREIVQLLAEGRSSKEVAGALNISVKTVETHRANIMRKLGLHSIAGVIYYAIRNHIVEV